MARVFPNNGDTLSSRPLRLARSFLARRSFATFKSPFAASGDL
jgi:hypothetical protein